jgi:hypothetical protein
MRGARIRVKPSFDPPTTQDCYLIPGPGVLAWVQDDQTIILMPGTERVIVTDMTLDEVMAELDAALRRETRDGSP